MDFAPYYSFSFYDLSCYFTSRALGSFTFARAKREDVLENYRLLEKTAGIAPGDIVRAHLANGTKIARVYEEDRGRGVTRDPGHLKGVDALYTNVPDLYISLTTADCFPLILYDLRNRAVGIAHCGWRGIVGRLDEIILSAMAKDFGTDADSTLAVIGPGIRSCCYLQHDDGLRNAFREYQELPLIEEHADGTYSIDIALALKANIASLGISQVVDAKLCTGCSSEFYSARKEGFATGRMLNLAGI